MTIKCTSEGSAHEQVEKALADLEKARARLAAALNAMDKANREDGAHFYESALGGYAWGLLDCQRLVTRAMDCVRTKRATFKRKRIDELLSAPKAVTS